MTQYPATTFSPALVDRVGDIGDVLAEFLDTQTAQIQQALEEQFPGSVSNAVTKVLSAFITLEGTKRPLAKNQVHLPKLTPAQIDFCLDQLEKARILRLEDDLFELAHDTLARQIADQRSTEDVAFLEVVKLVKDRYKVYHTTTSLLNANELHLVDSFRRRLEEEESFSPEEWAYVTRSIRENRRKRILLTVAISAVILVLAAFSLFSFRQWQTAQQQQALAVEAQQRAEDNLRQLEEEQAQKAEAQYREHLARGRSLMTEANYLQAAQEFETALAFKEGDEEALRLKAESEGKSGAKERFDRLLQEGDRLFDAGAATYVDALERYRQARATGYDNATAEGKISLVSARLEGAFESFRKAGNTFFAAGGYQYALEQYRQALRIKPDNREIQQRIAECKEKMVRE